MYFIKDVMKNRFVWSRSNSENHNVGGVLKKVKR